MTKEFNAGKRVRYILPLRMYLFVSIIYFFVLSLESPDQLFTDSQRQGNWNFSFSDDEDEKIVIPMDSLVLLTDSLGKDELAKSLGVESDFGMILVQQLGKIVEKRGEGFSELILKNVSFLMFILLPIFALLLFIFFRKNKYYYLEHLVHAFHLHAFIFLFLSGYLLFSFYVYDIFHFGWALLITLIYIFFSLKNVYGYKFWGTFLRGSLLIFLYNIVLLFGIVGSILLSLYFY